MPLEDLSVLENLQADPEPLVVPVDSQVEEDFVRVAAVEENSVPVAAAEELLIAVAN